MQTNEVHPDAVETTATVVNVGDGPAWKPEIVDSQKSITVANPYTLLQLAIEKGFDAERIGQMMDLQDRFEAKQALAAFTMAFNAAQAEMPAIIKDKENKDKKSWYARLEAVNRIVVPCYTNHGFGMSFTEKPSTPELPVPDGCRRLVGTLSHIGGHSKEFMADVPLDGVGAKGGSIMNATQGYVSTTSYAQRVVICRAWNLTIEDSDQDGETANATLTDEQCAYLRSKMAECETLKVPVMEARFIRWIAEEQRDRENVKVFEDIQQRFYVRAKKGIEAKVTEALEKARTV